MIVSKVKKKYIKLNKDFENFYLPKGVKKRKL